MNFRSSKRAELELNITPLIDIVFLLLIFFMVSTTFQKQSSLQIQLPKSSQKAPPEETEPVTIAISEAGRYAINDRKLEDNTLGTLKKRLDAAAGDDKNRRIVVRADKKTPHEVVVRAMDAAAQLGLDHLAIATIKRHDGDN